MSYAYANPFGIEVEQDDETGARWYFDRTSGLRGPSVTTAISLSPPWASRWPQSAQNAVEYARQRGTELHHANALYAGAVPGIELDWDSLDDDVRPRMESIVEWKEKVGWVTLHAEIRLFHPMYGYGGTLDEIGIRRGIDERIVLDFKPPVAPLAGVQLAGYALLMKHAFELRYAPGRVSLHLDGKGPAKERELQQHARDRDAFLAYLSAFQYGHERKLW